MNPLTCDDFLGGKVRLWQPARGYRAGVDPVLLAASVPARAGDSVLELGCGAGAASLCLAARVSGLRVTGVELQPAYADLARRNARENGVDMTVIEADLGALPMAVKSRRFDHVIMNPPYFDRTASISSTQAAREAAMGEATPLKDWLAVAARRLAPRGYLSLIHRAERLPEIMTCITGTLGSIRLRAIEPRAGRAASLVLVQARKEGRAAFVLEPPLRMHAGARHMSDRDDYTPEVVAILRDGQKLPECS
ncbi:tRNA1(Val) (adenine(37)-N6)-methyltransferase [Aquimixticola soesokkakensis]|uniref:tRNA1(Val) (Adenine(37)-N6)-methyltransferase n=1 Tax=Aquimixticola soesokkakensis TaxID=1519096 RepID=A0A1Y5SZ46_9RHOB|nr:methyltransferase domain-containing protein [Aquimixticola soesokkakensis]SLN48444.1 tRNA1(Val) (adenine(37)-N6)-methyltransferase [Aquimixticola soesokkakensis]